MHAVYEVKQLAMENYETDRVIEYLQNLLEYDDSPDVYQWCLAVEARLLDENTYNGHSIGVKTS